MEDSEHTLTELQLKILDGMADDYEDVEQLYLHANREFAEEEQKDIHFPRMLIEVRFALRDITDEIVEMLHEGLIKAKYSNDDKVAPLSPIDLSLLHHYWFAPTEKGEKLRKACRANL